jgi:hypothetical protein
VLDVDGTSESTYSWDVANDFGFDPVKQQKAIDTDEFTAIKQTLELTNWAHSAA